MAEYAVKPKHAGKDADFGLSAPKHSDRRKNRTEIPSQLKARMERSTGLSFDDARVHYDSSLPAKLDALAYTKGDQVEIGPDQEQHLPHELGHVVQQKLEPVRANARHSSDAALNTDAALERQADEMGGGKRAAIVQRVGEEVVQRSQSSSDKLRKNMLSAGRIEPSYSNAAHHIVAGNAYQALDSRILLDALSIDINDSVNGVFLAVNDADAYKYHTTNHRKVHTNKYFNNVNNDLF